MRWLSPISLALVLWSCGGSDAATGLNNPDPDPLPLDVVFTRADLGTLGGEFSYAADINGADVIVGWSQTAAGATHAFRWSAGSGMVDLGTLPGDATSRAVAILDGASGDILGMSGENGRWTPVIWNASGSARALPITFASNPANTLPQDFNSRGEVVGSDAGALQRGWIWSQTGGKHDLSANANAGSNESNAAAVTGSGIVLFTSNSTSCTRNATCWRTYLWSKNSGYSDLGTPDNNPEASVTGLGVSENGSVVGWASAGGTASPYLWTPEKGFTRLANYATGQGIYGYATAINSSGTIVGGDLEPVSGSIVASAWLASGSIIRLSPIDPYPSVAVAVNNSSTIAGWATLSSGANHAVVWRPSVKASGATINAPIGVATRVVSVNAPCLAKTRLITSRQALFECVIDADSERAIQNTKRSP